MSTKRVALFIKLSFFVVLLVAVCLILHLPTNTIKVFQFSKWGTTVTDTHFVSRAMNIAITAPAGAKVYYTTDGSTPDENAQEYLEPLVLTPATGDFPNCLLLKAAAYYSDGTTSEVETHTFFGHVEIKKLFENMIVSISGDPRHLTQEPDGILATSNIWKTGTLYEREIHIEAISPNGRNMFEQDAGMRIYGGKSRRAYVKSLKLFARNEYDEGYGKFIFDLFGTAGHDNQAIGKYDKLVLRNGGNDFQNGFIRDELNQILAEQAGYADTQGVITANVYLNGQFYGVHWLHENYCDSLFKSKYGGENGVFEVIEGGESGKIVDSEDSFKAAAAEEFNQRYAYFVASDLTDEAVYAELCDFIDIKNYLQYYAFNIYIGNWDWPQNNHKCYRFYAEDGQYKEGPLDGRWRFLYHDMDISMAFNKDTPANWNSLQRILQEELGIRWLFTGLMKRADCRQFFLSEMKRLMNGALSYENVVSTVDAITASRSRDMARYINYLEQEKEQGAPLYVTELNYQLHLSVIKEYAKERVGYLKTHLTEAFNLQDNYFN